ncbi:MAG: Cof-type HAD-IIB family hydrolase [Thomasclavelia sp.]|jgi:Cof subfamily protein (haloacid dehalogenase superfamily)|nr:Cof-type HAD-IIB family hydrolase [Thomasclavelia sp.]
MKYKAIALDLDGTLKTSDKKISSKTKSKLIELSKRGIKIILASGRPTAGIIKEANELELDKTSGYILSFNGARITEYPSYNIMYDKTYGKDYITKIYNRAKEYNLGVLTYEKDDIITSDDDQWIQEESDINHMHLKRVDNFLEYVNHDVNKLLLTGKPEYVASIVDEFKKPYEGKLSIYRSAPFFIEVMANNIDKGQSLDALMKELELTSENLIAFGDGYNDLPMIEYAGLGVAMKNGCEEVLNGANEVTLSNDEDGIYVTLSRLEKEGLL